MFRLKNKLNKINKYLYVNQRYLSNINEPKLVNECSVAIVGGGIIGNSIAYNLSKLGMKDVIVLERDEISSGTTWHAAGLCVTFGTMSETSMRMRQYTKELYSQILEEETEQSTGFIPCGFIELASNNDRLEEYRRVAEFNRLMGVDVKEITPNEVQNLFPLANVSDIVAGFYVPDDGRVNPVDANMALSKGAKKYGAKIYEGIRVKNIDIVNGKINGVETIGNQYVKCKYVVNAAGMWASQLGKLNNICIPNQAAEHYYLITDAIESVQSHWPVIEDPSSYTYIRPEGSGLLVGLFEGEGHSWSIDGVSNDFSFGEIDPNMDRIMPYLEKAVERINCEVGMKKLFCGPESFTPDVLPICGESREVENYFIAAGLNSIGILTGPGIGKVLAHWIINNDQYNLNNYDITQMNADRFHPYHNTKAFKEDRVKESLGNVYKTHYPFKPNKTSRNVKFSPLYYIQKNNLNAYFRDVSGWEMPDWYGNENGEKVELGKLSFGRPDFFNQWKFEHDACRNDVALIDMSFMSKFIITGKNAGELLNYLSTANVDDEHSKLIYTQWLNEHGKLEADLTVGKLPPTPWGEQQYMVIATDTMHYHVETWMRRKAKKYFNNDHINIIDVTGQYGQINIQGPNSRQLLQSITDEDLSDEIFPFKHFAYITIGTTKLLCARLTYVGELGYELYIPSEQTLAVYNEIINAGQQYKLQHVGLKSLASLRMEKGYRDYGHDMDNTDNIFEVGLGFTISWDKPNGFIGKDYCKKEKELHKIPLKRLVQVLCKDAQQMMYHNEIVLRNNIPVGYIRVASYGHSLNGSVGLAMIERGNNEPCSKKWIDEGKWTVNIAGNIYDCDVSLRPLYDPTGEKIKSTN